MTDEITLESIFAKEVQDLTEEEVTHLNEHKNQLTQEQLEKFSSVLTDGKTNTGEDDGSNDDDDDETKT